MRTGSYTGISGVSHTSNGQGNYYTRAIWTDLEGIDRWKTFSHKLYGEAEALRLAIECRNENMRLLQEAGAGYSERHIKGEQNV